MGPCLVVGCSSLRGTGSAGAERERYLLTYWLLGNFVTSVISSFLKDFVILRFGRSHVYIYIYISSSRQLGQHMSLVYPSHNSTRLNDLARNYWHEAKVRANWTRSGPTSSENSQMNSVGHPQAPAGAIRRTTNPSRGAILPGRSQSRISS